MSLMIFWEEQQLYKRERLLDEEEQKGTED